MSHQLTSHLQVLLCSINSRLLREQQHGNLTGKIEEDYAKGCIYRATLDHLLLGRCALPKQNFSHQDVFVLGSDSLIKEESISRGELSSLA